MALTVALRGAVHRDAAGRSRCSCSRGGISSKVTRLTHGPRARRDCRRWPSCCSRRAVAAAGGARARAIRRRRATTSRCTCTSGDRGAAADRRLQRAGRRRLLDPRDSVLRRHQAAAADAALRSGAAADAGAPTPRRLPAAVSAARLTTTLDPRFNIAYRFGAIFLAEPYPGGAGRPDLAIALLEKGLRARPDKWEYMQDIGFVHYWYAPRLPGGGRLVREGQRRAGRAVVAAVAGGDDAGAGRRPAVVARDVGGDPRSRPRSTGCARTPSAACCSSGARRDRRAAAGASTPSRAAPGSRRRTGRRWSARGVLRGVPVDPDGHAVRARRPTAASACRRRRRSGRCPRSRQRALGAAAS